ncbi:hypothetical protein METBISCDRAFT_29078, partial [Metschnikowia bicuspidata]
MWGLRLGLSYEDTGSVVYFFSYYILVLLFGLVPMSTATLAFVLGAEFSTSLLLIIIWYQVQHFGCGYVINKNMPVYVRWFKYVAFFWYALGALVSNQYTNWTCACPYPADNVRYTEYTSNFQLVVLGYQQNCVWAPIGYLLSWLIGFNAATILVLHYIKND